MNSTNIKSFFFSYKALVVSIAVLLVLLPVLISIFQYRGGQIAAINKAKSSQGIQIVVKDFNGKELTDSFQPWPELISEGKTFGIDFSNPIFQRIYSPTVAKRVCTIPQSQLLRNKELHRSRNVVCFQQDGLVTTFSWVDKSLPLDTAITIAANNQAAELVKSGVATTTKAYVEKLKEVDGITYYKITIGSDYSEYRAVLVIENKTTANLGVKTTLEVAGLTKTNQEKTVTLVEKRIQDLKNRVRGIYVPRVAK